MTPRSRGTFVLGLVVGAICAAAILFSIYYVPRKGITFGKDSLPFTVVLEKAHGLRAGSPVLVSGIEAGEVTGVKIKELDGLGWRVLVAADVFDGERFGPMLRTGSTYAVSRSGLLGEMVLSITPGGEGQPLENGSVVDGSPPTDFNELIENLTRVSKRLADFMDGRKHGDPSLRRALLELQGTLRNLRDFSEKLP